MELHAPRRVRRSRNACGTGPSCEHDRAPAGHVEAVTVRVERLEAARQHAEHRVARALVGELGLVEAGQRRAERRDRGRRTRARASARRGRPRTAASRRRPRRRSASYSSCSHGMLAAPRRRSGRRRTRARRRSRRGGGPCVRMSHSMSSWPSSAITSPKSSGWTAGPWVTASTRITRSGRFSSSSSLRSSSAPAGAWATPSVWLLLLKNA